MTIGNFTVINRSPVGRRADVFEDGTEFPWGTFGIEGTYDILQIIIGDFSNTSYNSMTLTNFKVITPYSIEMGFVFMATPYNDFVINPKPIPVINDVNGNPFAENYVLIGDGIKQKAIFPTKRKGERSRYPAATFFRSKTVQQYMGWGAKVKPYSEFGSPYFDLDLSIRFPAPDINRYSYLVIIVGGPPTILSEIPIFVTGQINFV